MCIEKCLHFKRKCRHHPHPILDILPVYLTRGISIVGGLFRTSPFLRWEKPDALKAKAHKKKPHRFSFPVWQFLFFRFKIADQIPCWQYISLIIKECLIRPFISTGPFSLIYFGMPRLPSRNPEPGSMQAPSRKILFPCFPLM